MDRNFYYIGIAFFGMINGLFNQLWLLFALLHVQSARRPAAVRQRALTLMFASLMVSTATIILGGIPAAIYERVTAPGIQTRYRSGSGSPAPRFWRCRRPAIFSRSASSRATGYRPN